VAQGLASRATKGHNVSIEHQLRDGENELTQLLPVSPRHVPALGEVLPLRHHNGRHLVAVDDVTAAVLQAWRALRSSAGVSWELRTALDDLIGEVK
jgi:hypothetical protein